MAGETEERARFLDVAAGEVVKVKGVACEVIFGHFTTTPRDTYPEGTEEIVTLRVLSPQEREERRSS